MRDLATHNTTNNLATVDSHSELQLDVGFVFDLEGDDLGQQVQSHLTDLHRVLLPVLMRNTRGNHVGVTNSLHLVHVISVNPVIEHLVEVVEEVNDLVGGADGADVGEAHDVAEEDAGAVKDLGACFLSNLEFLDDWLREK